jgi:anti-sigma B factor antagonist
VNKCEKQPAVDHADQIQVLRVQGDLDLATADAVYQRGRVAIARRAWLLLLDLTGCSFCDARGLSAVVRIANDADAAGCRYALVGPKPPVANILRITGLATRLPVFATIEQARRRLTTRAAHPHAADRGRRQARGPVAGPRHSWLASCA